MMSELPILPPAWPYDPDTRNYFDGVISHVDDHFLVGEQRSVGGVNIVCLRPAEPGERPGMRDGIEPLGQPVFLSDAGGRNLRPFTYYGYNHEHLRNRFGEPEDSFHAHIHRSCPACGGKGTEWPVRGGGTHWGGCWFCEVTFRSECPWVIRGREETTGLTWIRQGAITEEEAQRVLQGVGGDRDGISYRIERREGTSP